MRKQKDSNLRSLAARHVSNVLVSTAHPYFRWISGAKVQYPYAAFLRSKNYFARNHQKIGYNFEMYKKEKSCKSLTYRTLSKALQDGLEPEYMKPTEIIRNYKKLNTNKLHKRIER